MNAATAWFRGRSPRERRLILAMLALFAVTTVWAGVIRPVRDGLAAARERHASAAIRLGETQAAVDAVRAIQRARPSVPTGPLADTVRARAEAAGFTLASLDPDGDRIRIAIPTARPGALLAWIAGLEADGILADQVTMTGNGDGTAAAQLTLKARGS